MQKIIKGNKGEWSELFVLVSLIAEGRMHQADINLNIDPNNTYDVISAYKNESNYILEFSRSYFRNSFYFPHIAKPRKVVCWRGGGGK